MRGCAQKGFCARLCTNFFRVPQSWGKIGLFRLMLRGTIAVAFPRTGFRTQSASKSGDFGASGLVAGPGARASPKLTSPPKRPFSPWETRQTPRAKKHPSGALGSDPSLAHLQKPRFPIQHPKPYALLHCQLTNGFCANDNCNCNN